MKKEVIKNIVIALLCALTLFSIFKYVASLKEKYDLFHALTSVKEQTSVLEKEKVGLAQNLELKEQMNQSLEEQNLMLKDNLRASKRRIERFFDETDAMRKSVEQYQTEVPLLKAENQALRTERTQFKLELRKVNEENQALKVKLSSIGELKKVIRDLKVQMRNVGRQIKQQIRRDGEVQGNKGFIIKNGQITYPTKLKIEVTPATDVK